MQTRHQNVKCKIIKHLDNNTGENLGILEYDGDFIDIKPKAQSMEEIINKLDFIKTKNLH